MILKTNDITMQFGGVTAVYKLNIEINDHEIIALIGPNGAGKTTLLKCILGFEKWSAGRLLLDNVDVSHLPSPRFWQRIAYVPQAKSAPFSYTVEETVLLGRSSRVALFGKPSAHDLEVAHTAIDFIGIKD